MERTHGHNRLCMIEGCYRPARTRGWCEMHYERWRRHGDPLVNLRTVSTPVIERLMAKVEVDGETQCWVFTGSRQSFGHGLIRVGERVERAHRVSYEHHVGPIPDGLTIDHLCRNPPCVNPAHLEAVPLAENTRRGFAAREQCRNGHNYADAGWQVWPDGRRMCAVCYREIRNRASARRRERRREGADG